jgi:uncharacterized protein (TIGR03083 family)
MSLDHLALLEDAVAQVGADLAEADPAAPVPSCPGWTVEDLAAHLVAGHRWAAAVVLTGEKQTGPDDVRRPPVLAPWFGRSGAALLAALRAVDPDESCWNFAHVDERAGFWSRRRLHELLVHGADLRKALGVATPVDPAPAADGVDEMFTVFLPRMLMRKAAPAVTVPIGVATTDTGDAWTLTPSADPATVTPVISRAAGEVEATLSGTAAEVYLALWGRGPAGALRVDGDDAAAAAFLAAPRVP